MQVDCAASLALVADFDSSPAEALERCGFVLSRWEQSEDHHYAVWGLRLSASLFAQAGRTDEAHACADGLTRIATSSGHGDALAALAHALGEIALAEGEPELAAEQLGRAVELHRELRIPAERAQILHRAGVALAAAGQRELAIERQAEAYRLARQLAARPLAGRAAAAIEALGESAEQRLGRAAADGESPLTRREQEVVRLVAGRPHEPRDRRRALPQPAHRRHARPQHPRQARLPLPGRGQHQGRRGRPARLTSPNWTKGLGNIVAAWEASRSLPFEGKENAVKVREHLTFANVVACIALFVSLGGIGYAATSLPKNSVGPGQLKPGAVTPAKLNAASKRMLVGAAGPVGPRGSEGAQGQQGPQGPLGAQGPGTISFEVPVSNVPGPIRTFNGVNVYGNCSASNGSLGLTPQPQAGTLTASGFATINGTFFPIKEVDAGGGTFGSGTAIIVIDAIARNVTNGPAFAQFNISLKAPDCVVRGTITPSTVG